MQFNRYPIVRPVLPVSRAVLSVNDIHLRSWMISTSSGPGLMICCGVNRLFYKEALVEIIVIALIVILSLVFLSRMTFSSSESRGARGERKVARIVRRICAEIPML